MNLKSRNSLRHSNERERDGVFHDFQSSSQSFESNDSRAVLGLFNQQTDFA